MSAATTLGPGAAAAPRTGAWQWALFWAAALCGASIFWLSPHPPMVDVPAHAGQVAWAITNAEYKLQKKNLGVTEIVKAKGRGHALTIDSGWREVASTALEFVRRFV